MREALAKLDRSVYRTERTIVVGSLVVMSIVVFLDVMHRTFADPKSRLAEWIVKIGGWLGWEIMPGSGTYDSVQAAAPFILFGLFVGLTYFGIRTAKRDEVTPPLHAAGAAVVIVLIVYGLIRLMIKLVPNGFIWSQPLALILTLWVGFVGASMCTYEGKHLKVEAVQRFLPKHVKPYLGFVSGLLTAGFCLLLTLVSWSYIEFNYAEYVDTEGRGGMVKGVDVPKFVGFLCLPMAFGIMTVRFVGGALAALRGQVEEADPVMKISGRHSSAVSAASQPPMPPSDVPTEAAPALRDDDLLPQAPSDVDTAVTPIVKGDEAEGLDRPSDVSTEVTPVISDDKLRRSLPSQVSTDSMPVMDVRQASGEIATDSGKLVQKAPSLVTTDSIPKVKSGTFTPPKLEDESEQDDADDDEEKGK